LKAVQEGKSGSDCRGEENEVSKRQMGGDFMYIKNVCGMAHLTYSFVTD
jgi:hypothetical protein